MYALICVLCMYINLLARTLLADWDVLSFSHWLLMKQAQEVQLFQVSIVTWFFGMGCALL